MWLTKILALSIIVFCVLPPVQAANDPTRPPFAIKSMPRVAYTPLKLSMILDAGDSRRAIINETVVSVSDTVAGAKVIRINASDVLLWRAGEHIKLEMPFGGVRKDSENG